jgi:hypothetical protein
VHQHDPAHGRLRHQHLHARLQEELPPDELGCSALCAAILGSGMDDKLTILDGAYSPTEMLHTTTSGDGDPLDDGGSDGSPTRDVRGWQHARPGDGSVRHDRLVWF